ncbi:NitT/TauT family transport system substrate-binding protein/sulfonate transport system substrate-binding protein [Alkalispirochaeta americana]|uniref:NitT/TauT family transport system substrate-binding protein/sulfonate transport system substrate-binding protein n=1 Tax=Alkalispirochaeta americana TaxID=159291 RepID=A0A1N6T566_9SPIO|nr:NrtA/SsuA/CpmA family ABC transporter substrate-binding protein [Alkalispirochaeta americana]SIQ48492.1 NitT/TauT family transport system substrate-binding protein/sulfonate transport system substrate-binding protein [Alkalispirochaeta americana]
MKRSYTVSVSALLLVLASLVLFVSAGRKEAQVPSEINVSYVTSPFNLPIIIMREKGLLEEEFAPQGITINWHEITSGAHQATAMAAGSLDIASVINSTSVILSNAAGNEVIIAAGFSRPQQTFGIMAGPDGPSSVADLRGARVAGPKGTVLHQILVSALDAHGMSEEDIEFFSMGLPQARMALLAGEVDAALQAASLIIRNQEAGYSLIATAEGYVVPKLVVGVRPRFLEHHPDLVERYRQVQERALAFIEENLEEAIAIGAAEHEISLEDAWKLYEWGDFMMHLSPDDLASLSEDVEFLLAQGMIETTLDALSFVDEAALAR